MWTVRRGLVTSVTICDVLEFLQHINDHAANA